MTEKQYDIIDELYFVTTYNNLIAEVFIAEPELKIELIELLKCGYVYQLQYSKIENDYIKISDLDVEHINKYAYLASKEGLLIHNGLRKPD